MVNADLMDAIDRSLRQARGRRAEPFGGVQVVMFGDPYQLAPVPPRGDEAHYIRDHYRSFWFFDAKVWVGDVGGDGIIDIGSYGADLHIRELVDIHRQADPAFKAMLNAVRYGRVTADIAQVLNDTGARTPPDPADGEHPIITLATRNDIVNSINRRHLDELVGREQTAVAEISGDFGRGDASYPADVDLQAQGRRAGDVPAQRHRVVRRAAALGQRHDRHGRPASPAARCGSRSRARSSTSSRPCGRGSATRTTPARSR